MKNKYLNYFIILITVLLGVLLTTRFTNVFGSNTDWINQHTVIPEYFRTMFYETGKLIPDFSLNYGAGQNIYNLSYYGFLSPIILLSYLFPFINMANYITIINIIILIGSGILFYNFLQKHNINNCLSLFGSLILVLSAPFIFQMHRHIMFVNYMPFLIMALMGVDNFFNKNTKSLLIISVFLMIMTNYYYSVCGIIVVGVYYIYIYLKNNEVFVLKDFVKKTGIFIMFILISVLMSSILIVPTFYTLLQGRGQSETSISLLDLIIPNFKFHKIFCGTYAIGLTVISFISLLYLFFTKKKNNIIIGIIVMTILFLPFFRYLLNGGLYLREKCFIPFIPLCTYFMVLFFKDLFENKINIKKIIIYLLCIFILLLPFNIKTDCYIVLIGFLIVLLSYNKFNNKKLVIGYVLIVFSTILVIESFNEENVSKTLYNDIFEPQIEENIVNVLNNDKTYYRSNNLNYSTKTVNKIYNSNYFTTNIYSSTYNSNYLNFVRNVFEGNMIDYNYFLLSGNSNLLFNSYMGVKYLYSKENLKQGYIEIDKDIYLNENYYPIIYANNNIISENYFEKYSYPYTNELLMKNVIANKNANNSDVDFDIKNIDLNYTLISKEGVEITKNDAGYLLEVEEFGKINLKLNNSLYKKVLFISLEGLEENSCRYDNISMTINGISNILTCKTWIYANKNNTFNFIISEENIENLTITLTAGTYKITNISTYILDYDVIKNWKHSIKPFNITEFNNSSIKGNITIEDSSYLVTSIPYDEGFKVVINGKETSYENINEGFLGVYLEKGTYNVEIRYETPWLKAGKILSLIGLISFIGVLIIDKKNMTTK